MSNELPPMRRVMGVDFGLARIGIAMTDPTRTLASPFEVLAEKDKGQQIKRVVALAEAHEVAAFVVGIPFMLDGSAGDMAIIAEKYAAKLERVTGLPVVRWDERYTSAEAEERLALSDPRGKRRGKDGRGHKGRLDMYAAAVLLQDWLDAGAPLS